MSPSIKQRKNQKLKVALVAGEKSGDELGGQLINSLRNKFPNAEFFGLGGTKMIEAGLKSLFEMEKISVMGIFEPLLNIFELLSLRKQLKTFLLKKNPDIYVGIDAPDFNLPISRFLKKQKGIKTVQYVSPSVWAWRKGRIKTIEKSVDRVLTLFPFEKEAYKNSSVKVSFVGHPLAHKFAGHMSKKETRRKRSLPPEVKVIALLPGSRESEVTKMAKVLLDAAEMIRKSDNTVRFYMPFAKNSHKLIVQNQNDCSWINFSVGDSQEVLALSDIGIVTSGTASLEAALLRTPVVVAYKTSWLTYIVVKPMLKISHFALPNLLAGKMILPELIQHKVTALNLFNAFNKLDQQDYQNCLEAFDKIHSELKSEGPDSAANCIAEML